MGRCAGRISHGTFRLDGKEYKTPVNAGIHSIHSGGNAFEKKSWTHTIVNDDKRIGVKLYYFSPHMENGFPADLNCTVFYYILKKQPNALHTEFDANIPNSSVADASPINMFNHAYWNLNGFPPHAANGETYAMPQLVHNHFLKMPACPSVVSTDSAALPNGKIDDVKGALDFRRGHILGEGINDKPLLNREPCGYDHPCCVKGWKANQRKQLLNAIVSSPLSGITMSVYSTFPCIWVYSANNLPANASGKRGDRFTRYGALCLEPQYYPDNINQPSFPQSVVRKGKPSHEEMTNVFTVQASKL